MDPAAARAAIAGVFDRSAEEYDSVGVEWFRPIAAGLVEALDPQPGERVLDIGCGRGAALFPIAERVGPTGAVTGIDLAPRMVEATRADARARGLSHVDVHVGDAAAPDLQGTYDVVCGALVLFFLPDPGDALLAWRRLLTPGGRLGISSFCARPPEWAALDAVFQPYQRPAPWRAGPFDSDHGVESLLAGAGFTDVRTIRASVSTVFADVQQWYAWTWSHGQRAVWEQVPEAERPTVLQQAAEILDGCRDATGRLVLTQDVRYTLGRA